MEVDISCILDGAIVISVCKKGNELDDRTKSIADEEVINKYYNLAEKIKADILVFSTFSNWKQSAKQKLEQLRYDSKWCRIIIIEKGELMGERVIEI